MAGIRFDRGLLRTQTKPKVFDGVVARVHAPGDALEYPTGPEHRDLAGVQLIADQLEGLPIVTAVEPDDEHPLEHPSNLIIAGVEYHEIGRVITGHVDDQGQVVAKIYIHDRAALTEIEDYGTRELSLGYRCLLDAERYQRNIILDHLSVVRRARCGAACALRTDAVEATCPCTLARSVPNATTSGMKVSDLTVGMTITLDEKSQKIIDVLSNTAVTPTPEVVVTDETLVVSGQENAPHADCACKNHAIVHTKDVNMDLETLTKNLDAALAEVATLKTEIETLKASAVKADEAATLALNNATADLKVETARADKLANEIEAVKTEAQAKVDAAQAARTDADNAAFAAAVDARVDLLADAAAVGIEDAKSKTDREIKVAIVAKVDELTIDDTRSADFVNGMYMGAMGRHGKAAESVAEVRVAIEENKNDAADKAAAAFADPYKAEAEIREAAEAKRKYRWRS